LLAPTAHPLVSEAASAESVCQALAKSAPSLRGDVRAADPAFRHKAIARLKS
jgi:hypothetical protein